MANGACYRLARTHFRQAGACYRQGFPEPDVCRLRDAIKEQ